MTSCACVHQSSHNCACSYRRRSGHVKRNYFFIFFVIFCRIRRKKKIRPWALAELLFAAKELGYFANTMLAKQLNQSKQEHATLLIHSSRRSSGRLRAVTLPSAWPAKSSRGTGASGQASDQRKESRTKTHRQTQTHAHTHTRSEPCDLATDNFT